MKLLQVLNAHDRNTEFIIRACKLFNIEYHQTNSTEFPDLNYDIIWCANTWVNPDKYPNSKFIFGPQFWVFPNPSSEIFTRSKPEHKHRCIYVCLSDWIVKVFQEFADITHSHIPFVPIPFGLEDIQPKQTKNTTEYEYDCILYFKARHPSLLEFCESIVKAKGLRYKVYRYGSYQRQEYIETLKKTRFAIWIGSHESQGFGFQECLATNTPIFVYDVKSMKDEFAGGRYIYEHHKEQLLATTAGYWSDQCGKKVYSNEEFTAELDSFITNIPNYQPAAYVQQHLTDRVCFQRFLDALSITLPTPP
jgi:hypothetical protein